MDITEKSRPSDLPPPYSTIVNQPILPHPPNQPDFYDANTTFYPPSNQPGPYYPSAPPVGFPPATYGTISQPPQPITTTIILPPDVRRVGGCPVCRIGMLEDQFTGCGLCCAIFLFPLGILFCLLTKNKVCSHCRAEF